MMGRNHKALLLLLTAEILAAQPRAVHPGKLENGSILLHTGWSIQPAGVQIALETLPVAAELTADRSLLLVLQAGYQTPSVAAFDARTLERVGRIELPGAGWGLAVAPDGKIAYVSGGSVGAVFELRLEGGKLSRGRTFSLADAVRKADADFVGDVTLSPDGRLIYATQPFRDAVRIINPQSGMVTADWRTGRRPYRIRFHPDGRSFFVTGWADGSLHHHDANTGERLARVPLGSHPTDIVYSEIRPDLPPEVSPTALPWKARLFVTASNSNRVVAVAVTEAKDLRVLETLDVSIYGIHPLGMTPSALALDADAKHLYVACSDANAVAVVDAGGERLRTLGFLPTGAYPTALALLPGRLAVLNGHGGGLGPNPRAENAALKTPGSLSVIPLPDQPSLGEYTAKVLRLTPYNDKKLFDAGVPSGSPLPGRPGEVAALKKAILLVLEGASYDALYGALSKDGQPLGNGEKTLARFEERTAPNRYALARQFVLLDNFYICGDGWHDGHACLAASLANDYLRKLGPAAAAGRLPRFDPMDRELLNLPPAGYLWSNAAAAGRTLRNYGWWVANAPPGAPQGRQVQFVADPVLARYTSPQFRGPDAAMPDTQRVQAFLEEWKEFERKGEAPDLIMVRLGPDSRYPPRDLAEAERNMAEADAALGKLVEAVSHSPFWAHTAIFAVEAATGGLPDHVDPHRAPVLILSPYTRRGGWVDSTFYTTASLLRSIELILGLRPMTHFDAAAQPMSSVFSPQPDLTPYSAVRVQEAAAR